MFCLSAISDLIEAFFLLVWAALRVHDSLILRVKRIITKHFCLTSFLSDSGNGLLFHLNSPKIFNTSEFTAPLYDLTNLANGRQSSVNKNEVKKKKFTSHQIKRLLKYESPYLKTPKIMGNTTRTLTNLHQPLGQKTTQL